MQFVQAECDTQFAQIACHTIPVQEWSDMQLVQAECNIQFAQIACHATPAQEMCDMQSVQTECRTQFAQMACHATPVQEWSDMQSVQAECPNVDRLQSQRTTAHHIICNASPALQQKNVHEMCLVCLHFHATKRMQDHWILAVWS